MWPGGACGEGAVWTRPVGGMKSMKRSRSPSQLLIGVTLSTELQAASHSATATAAKAVVNMAVQDYFQLQPSDDQKKKEKRASGRFVI